MGRVFVYAARRPFCEEESMRLRTTVAALLSLALIVAGCGDDDSGTGGDGYSSEVRELYLEGCMTEQNRGFCECTLDELETRFSETEFMAFAIEASEEPPEEFVEIAFACLSEADLGG
jgi:hypothetical protein